jgi:hypothetical protein
MVSEVWLRSGGRVLVISRKGSRKLTIQKVALFSTMSDSLP